MFSNQILAAFAKLEEVATQADTRLRAEIGQVTSVIDTAIGKLKLQVDELASATAAAGALPQTSAAGAPPPAPGLGGQHGGRIDEMQAKCVEIGRSIEQRQQRASTIEGRVSDTTGMLSRHHTGLVQLNHAVCRIDERGPRQTTAQP